MNTPKTMQICILNYDLDLHLEAARADSLVVRHEPDKRDSDYVYLFVEYDRPEQLFYLGTQLQRLKHQREKRLSLRQD